MLHWVSWAGYLREEVTDRGLHNRRVFVRELSAARVHCTSIGLEAPYQFGKVERHGGIGKTVAAKVVEAKSVHGIRGMATLASEVSCAVNEKNRVGGLAPAQVLDGDGCRSVLITC